MAAGVIKTEGETVGQVRDDELPLKTIGGKSMQIDNTVLIVSSIGNEMQLHLVL